MALWPLAQKIPLPGGCRLALCLLGSPPHQPIVILLGCWPPHTMHKTRQIILLLLRLQNPMEFQQERHGSACRRAVGGDGGCRYSKEQPDSTACSMFLSLHQHTLG